MKSTWKESFHQISLLQIRIQIGRADLTIDTNKCQVDTIVTHQQNRQETSKRTTIHNNSLMQHHLHLKVLEINNNFTRVISNFHNNPMECILVILRVAQVIKQLNSVLTLTIVL